MDSTPKHSYITLRILNEKTGKEKLRQFPLYNNGQLNLIEVLEAFVGPTATLHSHSIFKSGGLSLIRISPEAGQITGLSAERFAPKSQLTVQIKTMAEDPERIKWNKPLLRESRAMEVDYARILSDLVQGKPKSFVDLDSARAWQDNKLSLQRILSEQLEDYFKFSENRELLKEYQEIKCEGSIPKQNMERCVKEVWSKLR